MPLEGLKVVALTWIIAGPASVRYFADHGATVVKIESELRPDGLRGLGPIKGEPGWNTSHFFGDFNAGMHSLQLNLKEPAALEIMKRLVVWADVVLDNWAPGAMDRAGLGYDTLREINPSVIMLSTSLLGQTGPAAGLAGFGYHAGAMAGFYEVTGWPDRPPDGPWMAYTDVIAPRFIAATVLAALDQRRRTGEGQYIDAAQLEMAIHFLAPEILDAQTSGHVATRLGNRSRDAAPQGIYPCAGDDQWCAIAVDTNEQWRALCQLLGEPEWARDPALAGVAGRLAAHDAIDEQLAAWTRTRAPHAAMDELVAGGVPAGAVQRSADLLRDPQYAHREFHRHLEHPEIGPVPYAGSQFKMSGYTGGPRRPSPLLGEHNVFVLQELLGLDDDEIADIIATGAIQ
jgi:benzylsuccinate CoA-transferase BbsF subunit